MSKNNHLQKSFSSDRQLSYSCIMITIVLTGRHVVFVNLFGQCLAPSSHSSTANLHRPKKFFSIIIVSYKTARDLASAISLRLAIVLFGEKKRVFSSKIYVKKCPANIEPVPWTGSKPPARTEPRPQTSTLSRTLCGRICSPGAPGSSERRKPTRTRTGHRKFLIRDYVKTKCDLDPSLKSESVSTWPTIRNLLKNHVIA